MAKVTNLMPDLTIHDYKSTGGTSWVQCDHLPAKPGILVLGATADFQVGYGDEPVNDYIHIENAGKMPFVMTVDDMSLVWVRSPTGSNLINLMSYPIGFGPIPYA